MLRKKGELQRWVRVHPLPTSSHPTQGKSACASTCQSRNKTTITRVKSCWSPVTNTKGEITHCNQAFVRVSGYGVEELIGQPHNIIRHPTCPPRPTATCGAPSAGRALDGGGEEAAARTVTTTGYGANVTPIMEGGKPRGYMSVRTKPSAQECAAAEELYAQMRAEADCRARQPAIASRRASAHGLARHGAARCAVDAHAAHGLDAVVHGPGGPGARCARNAGQGGCAACAERCLCWAARWCCGASRRWWGGALPRQAASGLTCLGCNLTSTVSTDFPDPCRA